MLDLPQYTPGEPQGKVLEVMVVVLETEVLEALGVVPDSDGKAANANRPTPRATITAMTPATLISFLYSDVRFTSSVNPGSGPYSLLDFREIGRTSC